MSTVTDHVLPIISESRWRSWPWTWRWRSRTLSIKVDDVCRVSRTSHSLWLFTSPSLHATSPPQRHTRCSCSRHHHFTLHHLPRHATVSALCDVTSASPVDPQLLPVVAQCRCSDDVIADDVTDESSRTSHRSSNTDVDFNDVSEVTWSTEPDVVYPGTPTQQTTKHSLRRY